MSSSISLASILADGYGLSHRWSTWTFPLLAVGSQSHPILACWCRVVGEILAAVLPTLHHHWTHVEAYQSNRLLLFHSRTRPIFLRAQDPYIATSSALDWWTDHPHIRSVRLAHHLAHRLLIGYGLPFLQGIPRRVSFCSVRSRRMSALSLKHLDRS